MNTRAKSRFLLAFIIIIYIGLPLCILFELISFDYKFYALTIGAVVVYAVFRMTGHTNECMGLSLKNWKSSLFTILPLTSALLIMGLYLLISGQSRFTPNEHWSFFIFYVFVSSPVQEFLYRGALSAYFDNTKLSKPLKMVTTSILYSFVHIIYKDALTLLLTFVIGLIWYECYHKDKTLVGVSISHAILGVVTIIAGVIN